MENLDRLYQLLQKPTWTEAEKQWLLNYLEQTEGADLQQILQQHFNDQLSQGQQLNPAVSEKMRQQIHAQANIDASGVPAKRRSLVWMRWVAAAAVITGVALTGWFWLHKTPAEMPVAEQTVPPAPRPDVLPGGDKAVLTLADGKTIVLDDAQNGALAQQGNIAVNKQGGKLIYNANDSGSQLPTPDSRLAYNTITIPRGGQYAIVLSDGTKVWLNAASSMRYPTAFTGTERRVEITGEAYFEVAKASSPKYRGGREGSVPFIVTVNGKQEVEVLGTHFNINAYDDEESIKTTLLEGKVKVSAIGSGLRTPDSRLLSPGEQAQLTTNHKLQTTNKIDIDEITAWKNGRFEFNGNTIQSVMRQLARWYDVDIVYEGNLPEANFVGAIERKEKLSQAIKMLELTNVISFKIQEKTAAGEAAKIIVMRR